MWMVQALAPVAVESLVFSPTTIPGRNNATISFCAVVPEIHTPYDFYYERIYLDA
jgi:hypothetical protein